MPFTPDHEQHGRMPSCGGVCNVRSRSGCSAVTSSSASSARNSPVERVPSTLVRVRSRLHDLGGRADADVGAQQRVLDLLPGLLVEMLARQHGQQAAAEDVLRPGQARAQPLQAPGRRLRRLDLRNNFHRRSEHLRCLDRCRRARFRRRRERSRPVG